ncbi:hypothetical protein HDE_13833 [Halotydeus destructor]|nr:hypothetical protein HDE_13833 [Halotydeus destructor]
MSRIPARPSTCNYLLLISVWTVLCRETRTQSPCNSDFSVTAAVNSNASIDGFVAIFTGTNYLEYNAINDNVVKFARPVAETFKDINAGESVRVAFLDMHGHIVLVTDKRVYVHPNNQKDFDKRIMADLDRLENLIPNNTVSVFSMPRNAGVKQSSLLYIILDSGVFRVCRNIDAKDELPKATEGTNVTIDCVADNNQKTRILRDDTLTHIIKLIGVPSAAAHVTPNGEDHILFFNQTGICKFKLATNQSEPAIQFKAYTSISDCTKFPALPVALGLSLTFLIVIICLSCCGYCLSQQAKRQQQMRPVTLRTNGQATLSSTLEHIKEDSSNKVENKVTN